MSQIMKITIYLLIALMLMGIEGCPSDQLASNEACSGPAPAFRLSVVSDTKAPFRIAIDSVGTAVHKTTKQRTQFNPITGVGPKFNMRISTKENTLGSIYDSTFRPTDIHKNKGCIKQYIVSAVVSGKWHDGKQPYTRGVGWGSVKMLGGGPFISIRDVPPLKPLLDSAPINQTPISLVCEAPEGKQIKTCTFTIKVGEEKNAVMVHYGRRADGGAGRGAEKEQTLYNLIRPKGNEQNKGTSISQTFANE